MCTHLVTALLLRLVRIRRVYDIPQKCIAAIMQKYLGVLPPTTQLVTFKTKTDKVRCRWNTKARNRGEIVIVLVVHHDGFENGVLDFMFRSSSFDS